MTNDSHHPHHHHHHPGTVSSLSKGESFFLLPSSLFLFLSSIFLRFSSFSSFLLLNLGKERREEEVSFTSMDNEEEWMMMRKNPLHFLTKDLILLLLSPFSLFSPYSFSFFLFFRDPFFPSPSFRVPPPLFIHPPFFLVLIWLPTVCFSLCPFESVEREKVKRKRERERILRSLSFNV